MGGAGRRRCQPSPPASREYVKSHRRVASADLASSTNCIAFAPDDQDCAARARVDASRADTS
ncbi:hypothetical protein PI86_15405 [Burkholderia sp. A9]|nr:hypothetical protein PI86_15405 [Burkholderia sp. A9]